MSILRSSEIFFFILKKAHVQVFTTSSIGGQMPGSKIPSDLANRKSRISVKKIVSGEWWEQKTDSQKGSQMNTRQSSQIRECCSLIQLLATE